MHPLQLIPINCIFLVHLIFLVPTSPLILTFLSEYLNTITKGFIFEQSRINPYKHLGTQ